MASFEEKDAEVAPESGELVFFGGTDWSGLGRTADAKKKGGAVDRTALYPNLLGPHRIAALEGIKICYVAAGVAAAHCIAIDTDGRCFTWGRNELGQLGHGDTVQRNAPTVVEKLAGHSIARAAGGKSHTVVVTDDGDSFSFGSNKAGQLGIGKLKSELETSPVKVSITNAVDIACGAEFNVWLTKGGPPYSCGLPQYGQLGDGSDHVYNANASSVKLVYDPVPTPTVIPGLQDKVVTKVACGTNHTVAVDSKGGCWTWGFGGHGRLGHKEQKDEFAPRQVQFDPQGRLKVGPKGCVAAGGAFSAAVVDYDSRNTQVYMWGQIKASGDAWMYPKALTDLSGWHVRSIRAGHTSCLAAADESCIAWGTSSNGELGFGVKGPKSSANPKKIDDLEGLHTVQVACGIGFGVAIVDTTQRLQMPELLKKLPVFSPPAGEVTEEVEKVEKAAAKRKATGKGKGKAVEEPEAAPAKKGKASGGRGRGRGK